MPAQVGQVAYRVVQEALTNVLRHAGPTTAEVSVHRDGDALTVQVLDRGVGPAGDTDGRGLAGMRDRVRRAGGELVALPRTDGGFAVTARLPLPEDAP
ncbi:MAG: hypothetical protein GEV07_08075 [Streptosporangiales bacterium]|nr:hypothetical protein [Streptosporangiales bacterium]